MGSSVVMSVDHDGRDRDVAHLHVRTSTMSRKTHSVVLYLSVAVAIFAVVVSVAATIYYSHRWSEQRKDAQIASCERGNVLRGVVNTIIVEANLTVAPSPMTNCKEIIR